MIKETKVSIDPSIFNSRKTKINTMVINELKFHSKKTSPVNSSKSIKYSSPNTLLEENIHFKHFKPIFRHSENSGKYFVYSNGKSKAKSSSVLSKRLKSRNSSQESVNYLADTQNEIQRNENFCVKNFTKPVLMKHKRLFELISQKSEKFEFGYKALNKKSVSCLKLEVEKTLHKEYMKDRDKLKSLNMKTYTHKKIWRPDCVKTLKRVEKIISSLPKTRDL